TIGFCRLSRRRRRPQQATSFIEHSTARSCRLNVSVPQLKSQKGKQGVADESLTRRQHAEIFDALTTIDHQFRLQPFRGVVLEVEDEHFHLDSAVMLPNYPATVQAGGPSLGLAVVAECLKHQDANPLKSVLIVGHADT